MLYAFLLCADPAGCSPEVLAERYLDRKLGAAAEQHADLAFTLAERLAPEIDQQGFRKIYEEIDLPLAVGAGAHGADRHPHRAAQLRRFPNKWNPTSSG